jgi:hypothetical protein
LSSASGTVTLLCLQNGCGHHSEAIRQRQFRLGGVQLRKTKPAAPNARLRIRNPLPRLWRNESMRAGERSRRPGLLVHAQQRAATAARRRCGHVLLPHLPAKNRAATNSDAAFDLATKSITMYFVARFKPLTLR